MNRQSGMVGDELLRCKGGMRGTKAVRGLSRALVLLTAVLPGCGRSPPYEGKTVTQLERMLHDPSPRAQAQGAYGLSLKGPEALPAAPALADLLDSPDPLVRQHAALALGKIGPEAHAAVPALTKALGDPEWTVRRHAALALGE